MRGRREHKRKNRRTGEIERRGNKLARREVRRKMEKEGRRIKQEEGQALEYH